jgi:hypothetical protein
MPATVAEWDRRLAKEERKHGLEIVTLGAIVLGLSCYVAWALITGHATPGFRVYWYGGPGTVGAWASYRRARRSRRALDAAARARAAEPAPMTMRLWWSVGDGWGPVPVASLRPSGQQEEIVNVPIGNVPATYEPEPWRPVTVYGCRGDGSTPVIVDGDVELWPAELAERVLQGHRRSRERWARRRRSASEGA